MPGNSLPKQTLQRLPLYLGVLKGLPKGTLNISATSIAEQLGLNDVQVRKDLACISKGGRPKTGYAVKQLIRDLHKALACGKGVDAVIVGMGNLGCALALYGGFEEYGLRMAAGFDIRPALAGGAVGAVPVHPVEELQPVCQKLGARIGIITTPPGAAQPACDALVAAGATAIWNFAPVHLSVPEGILVQNENMAANLAILSRSLKEAL